MTSCLIIDDDSLLRKMAEEVLVANGFQVRQASGGREGLELFHADPADVVLLDLMLPDVSGYDILPQLVNRTNGCGVVVMTALFSLESALRVLREGAGDYLPKPFTAEALLMSVERVLSRKQLLCRNTELSSQLQRRLDHLQVLHQISQLITSSKPLETWINEVVQATCAYIGAKAGSLLLMDFPADEMFFYVSTGPRGEAVREVRLPRGRGVAWWSFANRQAVKVDDVKLDPRFDDTVDANTGFSTRCLLAAPIIVREECIGVVELLNKIGAERFSDEDLKRLQELSSHFAVAVQNALVVRDLQHSREELARWSRQLEQIVEERTQALKKANRARQIAYQDLERTHRLMKRAQTALVEREKMAALGLLSAGVAHEINNPLGFVNANLATLEQYVRSLRRLAGVVMHAQSCSQADRTEQLVRLVREAGRVIEEERIREILDDLGSLFEEMSNGLARINGIVEQLRSFVEDGSTEGPTQQVDLNAEVSHLVELVHEAASDKLEVQCELSEIPLVDVPVRNLRQILLNLLSPSTRQADTLHKVVLRTRSEAGQVVLDLLNPESSLAEEDLTKLFDPFYEPGGNQRLGGIGLSAAYGLARNMGGSLRAFKQPEGGVCIQLTLPMAVQDKAGAEEQAV